MNVILRFIVTVTLFFTNVAILPSFAATQPNLWLPLSYQQYEPRLLEAAEKVRDNNDCAQLLSGTLDEASVQRDTNLSFTFRCRTEARKMFIIDVNVATLELTNELVYWRKQAEIKAEQERQDALRKKLAERNLYWQVCKNTFQEMTRAFTEPKIVSETPPKPDMTPEGVFIYVIEFQTLSEKKNVLSYLATAVIDTLEECDIEIRPI